MKIFVKAKPGSKREFVKRVDAHNFTVAVKAEPEKGKANRAILSALADYFDIPRSAIRIKAGHTAKNKIVEIINQSGENQ